MGELMTDYVAPKIVLWMDETGATHIETDFDQKHTVRMLEHCASCVAAMAEDGSPKYQTDDGAIDGEVIEPIGIAYVQ